MIRRHGKFSMLLTCLLIIVSPLTASATTRKMQIWLSTADQKYKLTSMPPTFFTKHRHGSVTIIVDDKKTYQTMEGFGHTLTGGSAELLMKMSPPARHALEKELFGRGPAGIGTSYLRITVAASDMNASVFTYDDLKAGQIDPELEHFRLGPDLEDIIPVLKEILTVAPHLKILASPWTAPAWMKDNGSTKGGHLKKEFYAVYAMYLVKYLRAMNELGIPIDSLTPQNEPENEHNTPSMVMTAEEEAEFIGKYLGPAISDANLKTKIIAFDHNCDHPQYPLTVLRDPQAFQFTDGSAFHLYRGAVSAMTQVHLAYPEKNIYFTEQMVVPRPERGEQYPLAKWVTQVMVGAPTNWARTVLLWNLAADAQAGPHTGSGGCPFCIGAVTLDGDNVRRNVAYYVAAHLSKFVPPGSVRIDSETDDDLCQHVAFLTPSGKHVLVLTNSSVKEIRLVVGANPGDASLTLPAGAVVTCVW